jgi:hypothetical protein
MTRYSDDELLQRLKHIRLQRVNSSGVRKLGYDPETHMAAVVFADKDVVYGYPNLTDTEVKGLLDVMVNQESLGHYVSTVIKKHHDFERVSWSFEPASSDF